MAALPKLSYVMVSYNREKYIRRAIESAFAQDYDGELEYIFSDDCSTDRTFEIIKECVAEYKGSRRVVVTQTPHNCHLAGNTNHAVSFVQSDWVIRADDDDIATPDRCTIIGKAIAEHPEATFVYTRQRNFTDAEEEKVLKAANAPRTKAIPEARVLDIRHGADARKGFFTYNCSHQAWSAKVYREFGPLPMDGYYVDDVICCMRANFLSYGLDIPVTTMYIRNGSNNMCRGGDDGQRGYQAIVRQEKFNDKYFNITLPPLRAEIERLKKLRLALPEAESAAMEGFFHMLDYVLEYRTHMATYWRKGTLNRQKVNKYMGWNDTYSKLRCLPLWLFAAIVSISRKFKRGKK